MTKNMPEKISNVCIRWQNESPFFAEFLLRFMYKAEEEVKTAAIEFNKLTHKLSFVYSPSFIDKLTIKQVEGLAVHEILHVLHKYSDRIGDRVHDIFNIAQDACINEIVKETTIGGVTLELPPDGVDIKDIEKEGYNGEHISEPVYDFLYDRADKYVFISCGAGGGDGQEGQCPVCGGTGEIEEDQKESKGNGQGESEGEEGKDSQNKDGKDGGQKKKCPVCGGSGKLEGKKVFTTTDNHEKSSKQPSEIERAIIEEIINSAKVRSWGNVSGNMISSVQELIKTKKIPWQRQLAMIMSKYIHEAGNIYENTWSRRNRRSLPLPGIRKLSKRIIVSVDTSGSIGNDDIQMFFGQIEKLVKNYSNMTLIQWDTQVHSDEPYKKGAWKKIQIKGRGGTDVQDLYTHLQEHHKNASVVVNFTDSFFSWEFENYGIPTVWAVVNNPDFKAPFGKTVIVETEGGRKRSDNWI